MIRIKTKINYAILVSFVIPFIIAAGLSVVELRQMDHYVRGSIETDVHRTFTAFTGDLQTYDNLRQEWRPRILSNFLVGRLINLLSNHYDFSFIIGLWTSAWLFIMFLLLICGFHEKAIFYIFGIFAGIAYGYTKSIGSPWVFPWDMPALFIYVVFLILVTKKKFVFLIPFTPIAMLFKETAIVMIIAFLFVEDIPLKKRVLYLVMTAILCYLVKTGIDLITHNPSLFLTMTLKKGEDTLRLLINLRTLVSLRLDTPFLINSGLLLSLMILPLRSKTILMFKLVAAVFIISNLIFGMITEYRIWFELIPLSLFGLQTTFFPNEGIQLKQPGDYLLDDDSLLIK